MAIKISSFSSYRHDLHLHSNISDGKYSPTETLKRCKQHHIKTVSFVEHNYVANKSSYNAFIADNYIRVIPGVEISTKHQDNAYHLIGYFKDFPNQSINKHLQSIVEGYEQRAKKIIKQCQNANIPISYERIKASCSEIYISNYAIAEEICKVMRLPSTQEVAKLTQERGNLFWVKDNFSFPETVGIINLIHKYGGVATLAHPGNYFWFNEKENWTQKVQQLMTDLLFFVKKGLDGLEVYYPNHPLVAINILTKAAQEYNLIMTGGSDWHGEERCPDHPLGSGGITNQDLSNLIEHLDKRQQSGKESY